MKNCIRVVEPETIDVKFASEIREILSEEMAALRMIEIDHCTPGGIAIEERCAGGGPENIIDAASVIEDDIDQDGQAVLVTSIDQFFQRIRATIGMLDRVEKCGVVSPTVARADFVDRQKEDGGNAEIAKVASG